MNFPTKQAGTLLRYTGVVCLLAALAEAPDLRAELKTPLTEEQMTNGQETLAALADLQDRTARHSALLFNEKDHAVITVTWVGEEGYFLTKASEVPKLDKLKIKSGSTSALVREVRRDVSQDLLLGQAVGLEKMPALDFVSSKNLSFGQWIASPTCAKNLKIGVVSARRRTIKGMGAAIGIRMDDLTKTGITGVHVVGVAEQSPAEAAGLKSGDFLLELDGQKLRDFRRVNELISKRQPGDEITLLVLRGKIQRSLKVRLASRTKVLANWGGEDFANGGISIRTDNFPAVLQHDMPLVPADMGGPVFDLNGQAIGLNIARVDRVTTFALPGETFWPRVQQWLEADRHPPKAAPAAATSAVPPANPSGTAAKKVAP